MYFCKFLYTSWFFVYGPQTNTIRKSWPSLMHFRHSLINFDFFYYYTLHILIKALYIRFLSFATFATFFATFGFLLLYFSYTSNIRYHCFINRLKSLTNLMKSLNFFIFSFVLSYSFSTLLIKTNSSWLILGSIKGNWN